MNYFSPSIYLRVYLKGNPKGISHIRSQNRIRPLLVDKPEYCKETKQARFTNTQERNTNKLKSLVIDIARFVPCILSNTHQND